MSVCVFVCPSHFLTPFNGLFAPTSRSPMSKLFRFSESLGKSNGKKWSQIWKLFSHKGCKIAAAKTVFYGFFFICSLRLNVFLPPLPEVQCPKFLDFQNPWRKVMQRSGLRFEQNSLQRCKITAQKKLVFGQILPYWAGFFWYRCFSLRLTVFLPPLPKVQCPIFLDFFRILGEK